MKNLLTGIKISYLKDGVTAGSSIDNDSDILDLAGFEGVLFVSPILDSVATGVATMTVEQNAANSGSGMAALAGAVATATSSTNDDLNGKVLAIDVYRPRERYLRVNRTSATANIAYGDVIAIQYSTRNNPIVQAAAEVAASTVVVSPEES